MTDTKPTATQLRDLAYQVEATNRTAQRLGEVMAAADKKKRMRRFTWCRAETAVFDDKMWRLVARMAGAPLPLVEAFVLRLDLHANTAKPRGSLDGFSVPALAAYWGVANEDVLGRIYAALEHPDVGWIDQDVVTTFWDRNPDTEDTTAADRTHRSKAFKRAMKTISGFARDGRIDAGRRAAMETALFALRDEARRGGFTRAELVARLEKLLLLSTEQGAHDVTAVTTVSLTTRADQILLSDRPVDNSYAAASAEAKGFGEGRTATPGTPRPVGVEAGAEAVQEPVDALTWLAGDGRRLLIERSRDHPGRIDTLRERWLREIEGDAAALMAIVKAVLDRGKTGFALCLVVGEEIATHRMRAQRARAGRELPLKTTLVGGLADRHPQTGPSQRDPHAVDNNGGDSQRDDLRKAVGES